MKALVNIYKIAAIGIRSRCDSFILMVDNYDSLEIGEVVFLYYRWECVNTHWKLHEIEHHLKSAVVHATENI